MDADGDRLLAQLSAIFPAYNSQVTQSVLELCDRDINLAIDLIQEAERAQEAASEEPEEAASPEERTLALARPSNAHASKLKIIRDLLRPRPPVAIVSEIPVVVEHTE